MNKTFIIVLAICLVSVHAMVKRDAPAADKDQLTKIQEQIIEYAKQAEAGLKEAMDPEKIKTNLSKLVDEVTKVVNIKTPETKA